MALHHFENQNQMLQEVFRVLRPGGIFVIREHDCNPQEVRPFANLKLITEYKLRVHYCVNQHHAQSYSYVQLAPVIDVLHGLYSRVWSDPPEMPEVT